MAITNLQTLSAVLFDVDVLAGSSVCVTGIKSSRAATGVNFQREITTGNAWAHFGAIYSASPSVTFSTLDISRCGAVIGLQGLKLLTDPQGSNTGFVMYGRKKAPGGVRASGDVNVAYTALDGMSVIRSISAGHLSDATMEVESHFVSANGTTQPLISTNDSALPTIPDDTHRFTLGPVAIGVDSGSQVVLTQKTMFEIDFQPTLEVHGSDSDIYNSIANLTTCDPIIRITTLDTSLMDTILSLAGKPVDSSHTYIYLRKRSKSSGTGFVANNVTEHIKFTPTDGCAYLINAFESTSPAGNAQATIEIPLIGTGDTFPISVNWATAIT